MDEFDLAQVVGADEPTAQEKMAAYRRALSGKRGFGLLGSISGDEALGGIGGQLLKEATLGEARLDKVPEERAQFAARQQQTALHKEQMDRIAAQNAARQSPYTAQVLRQSLSGYGVQVPEGTPVETMESLLPQARAAYEAKMGRADRAEARRTAAEDRADRAAERKLRADAIADAKREGELGKINLGDYHTQATHPLTEGQRNTIQTKVTGGLNALSGMGDLYGLLGTIGRVPTPQQASDVKQLTSDLIVNLNSVAGLGALSGPDMEILTNAAGDPTRFLQKAAGLANLQRAVKNAADRIRRAVNAAVSVPGGKPRPGSVFDPASDSWQKWADSRRTYWASGGRGGYSEANFLPPDDLTAGAGAAAEAPLPPVAAPGGLPNTVGRAAPPPQAPVAGPPLASTPPPAAMSSEEPLMSVPPAVSAPPPAAPLGSESSGNDFIEAARRRRAQNGKAGR